MQSSNNSSKTHTHVVITQGCQGQSGNALRHPVCLVIDQYANKKWLEAVELEKGNRRKSWFIPLFWSACSITTIPEQLEMDTEVEIKAHCVENPPRPRKQYSWHQARPLVKTEGGGRAPGSCYHSSQTTPWFEYLRTT